MEVLKSILWYILLVLAVAFLVTILEGFFGENIFTYYFEEFLYVGIFILIIILFDHKHILKYFSFKNEFQLKDLTLFAILAALIIGMFFLRFEFEMKMPQSWSLDWNDFLQKKDKYINANIVSYTISLFFSILVYPILSELYFRYCVQGYLSRKFNINTAVIVSAFLFSLAFFTSIGSLSFWVFNFSACYAFYKTGRIAVPIYLNMTFNALMIAFP